MNVIKSLRYVLKQFNALSPVQKGFWILFLLILISTTTLFGIFHKPILASIEPLKTTISSWRAGFLILMAATILTSFPPLIGYMTSITLTGFIYGFPRGWYISAVASIIGATITFLVYRTFLRNYAAKLGRRNHNFEALTRALDGSGGLTLLTMIRYCPFPFSLSNAALSTIPSISVPKFMLATALATPRLLVHTFVGSRLASLAEGRGSDTKSTVVNWVGICGGIALGIGTGWLVYKRTKMIATRLASSRGIGSGFRDEEGVFVDSGLQDDLNAEEQDDGTGLVRDGDGEEDGEEDEERALIRT